MYRTSSALAILDEVWLSPIQTTRIHFIPRGAGLTLISSLNGRKYGGWVMGYTGCAVSVLVSHSQA